MAQKLHLERRLPQGILGSISVSLGGQETRHHAYLCDCMADYQAEIDMSALGCLPGLGILALSREGGREEKDRQLKYDQYSHLRPKNS